MRKEIPQYTSIAGRMTIDIYDTKSEEASLLESQIQQHILNPAYLKETDQNVRENMKRWHRSEYLRMVNELKSKFMVRELVKDNLIVTVGRGALAKLLANDTPSSGVINYGALGDSATAATNGNTTLNNEVYRKVVASASTSNNIAFVDFFYAKADTNGTYEEFGSFIDGTGSVDTGVMFTHLITGGWTKAATESMTVACQYTIT